MSDNIEENQEEKELPVTEGGYRYLDGEDGVKIRESKVAYRLVDDGETYEEYRIRRILMQYVEKKQRRIRPMWNSSKFGTFSKEKLNKALEDVKRQENA